MKILLIHTQYQQKGGEDGVFHQDYDLLIETQKVDKIVFYNKSGLIGALQFIFSLWNITTKNNIKKIILKERPDIIHLYNWHYAIGPIVINLANKHKIPIVLAIQNFRLLCPSGTLLYKDKYFPSSLQSSFPWKGVFLKVYRDSYLQTFWLSFIIWFHKIIGTWKLVDRYIVATDIAKTTFINSSFGVLPSKLSIKPNFLISSIFASSLRHNNFLFIGRLSNEKGINTLLNTFINTDYELHIAGDGPLLQPVLHAIEQHSNIKYLGLLSKEEVLSSMRLCTALIFPSIWFEGMPMTILEAFSLGTPVIASNLGAMASMIQSGYNGLHFEAGNANSLKQALSFWQVLTETEKDIYRKNARSTYEAQYTPEINREQLLAIYQQVIDEKKAS